MEEESQEDNQCEVKMSTIEEILGPETDTRCGFGCLRGPFLQWFSTPITYLALSSTMALVQGTFFTYSYASISTIEKRYGISSRMSGFSTTGNDILELILAIPLTFIAGRGHRPRYLSFGMFISGVGCFIAALPHFVLHVDEDFASFSDKHVEEKYIMCAKELNSNQSSCNVERDTSSTSYYLVLMLLISQMMSGFASLLYYTVGLSYLDEAVSKEQVPLFFSISGAARLLGPVCAYAMASWSLKKWVYPSMTSEVRLQPSHPRWVGAWWIGYVITGSLLICLSWILALMPKMLPATRKRKEAEIETIRERSPHLLQSYLKTLRMASKPCTFGDFVSSLRRVLFNPIYILVIINQALFFFMFMGYVTFKSKYIEHQFRMSASAANKYIAVVSLIAALIGWVGTGASLTYLKPKPKSVVVIMAFLTTVSGVCHFSQMFISCETDDVIGLDAVLEQRPENKIAGECQSASHYSPVCHKLGSNMFFSACQAGCASRSTGIEGNAVYSNCSCISTFLQRNDTVNLLLDEGVCPKRCPSFTTYLVISVIAKMAHAAGRVPINTLLFRCVDERDKDIGLGVFNAVISGLSFIPAPIFFGWAIDSTCLFWDTSCENSSRCWLYNVNSFRRYIHGIPTVVLVLCLVTDLLLLRYHRSLNLYSEEGSKNIVAVPSEDPLNDTEL